ncbi:MAG: hypothetical protein ACFBWO_14000 [Paracoccaceae bacterium]
MRRLSAGWLRLARRAARLEVPLFDDNSDGAKLGQVRANVSGWGVALIDSANKCGAHSNWRRHAVPPIFAASKRQRGEPEP